METMVAMHHQATQIVIIILINCQRQWMGMQMKNRQPSHKTHHNNSSSRRKRLLRLETTTIVTATTTHQQQTARLSQKASESARIAECAIIRKHYHRRLRRARQPTVSMEMKS
jgi:hypothetical protein